MNECIISISSISLVEDKGNSISLITMKEKDIQGNHIGIRTYLSVEEIKELINK